MRFDFHPISETDNVLKFNCEEKSLDDFLKKSALIDQNRRLSATTVAIKEKDELNKVVGYYTICPTEVKPKNLSLKQIRGLPKERAISGILLCRLARDLNFKGTTLGQELLIHCLKKCYHISSELGGYVVIVDAINERVAELYEEYGFKQFREKPLQLAIKMSEIRKNFGFSNKV